MAPFLPFWEVRSRSMSDVTEAAGNAASFLRQEASLDIDPEMEATDGMGGGRWGAAGYQDRGAI